MYTKSGGGSVNVPEIEKEEYGYELFPGQKVYLVRYDSYLINKEMYIYPTIAVVDKNGIKIKDDLLSTSPIWLPWVKDECNLYIEPCEVLYERNRLEDILSGNIKDKTLRDRKVITEDGEGIWYKHGGKRTTSIFESNLQYFIKLGQQKLSLE